MSYSFLRSRYDGHLSLGQVATKLPDCRPFSWAGSIDFSIAPNAATINSFRWGSGHSTLSARGTVSDFRHPLVRGSYEAHIDLAEVAAVTRNAGLRGGTLDLHGDGNRAVDKFAARGQVDLRDVVWSASRGAAPKGSLVTDYSITEEQFRLSKLQGKLFGGSFNGDVEVNQWLTPTNIYLRPSEDLWKRLISAAPPLKKNSRQSPGTETRSFQSALISLHFRDFSLEDSLTLAYANVKGVPDFILRGLPPELSRCGGRGLAATPKFVLILRLILRHM